ncbi:heavy metal translocating P-type ATPase [Methylobacterium sp. EM32]|uniref:heavy metal translocating P-type ATPase n=1 Tax=Methylobacterium sp. EM32 TaxID=3163481 RepID=UPI0033B175DC
MSEAGVAAGPAPAEPGDPRFASAVRTRFHVAGMDCGSCAAKIDTAVRRIDGVKDVNAAIATSTLTVEHSATLPLTLIERQVKALGYGIQRDDVTAGEDGRAPDRDDARASSSWWRAPKVLLAASCAAALAVAYVVAEAAPGVGQWVMIPALAVGLVPIARRAVAAALAGSPFTIETLMSIAALGAVAIGATSEAATVVLLFLVGELLEGVAAGRARASIRDLARLVPRTALEEQSGGGTKEVAADVLRVGSTILVRPGDRIPADGDVLSGEGGVDEAPVTGESTPKTKVPGDAVFAGTVNLDGALRVKVTAAAEDNTIARVVRLVEEAQEAKAPTERVIERFARFYTPAVMIVALLVAVVPPLVFSASWSEWVYKGLATLLIGCPCALVISTPAAVAAGLSAGARRGLLLKGGAVLEQVGRVTVAAFDKTGTLSVGKPKVTDVLSFGRGERDVLSLSAALEEGSAHPLARAILAKAKETNVPVPPAGKITAVAGKGVTGIVGGVPLFLGSPQAASGRAPLTGEQVQAVETLNAAGASVAVLVAGDKVAGLIAMRDEPRPDAAAGIAALRQMGITSVMLTGDNERAAQAVATTLGIEARAELLPEDKQRVVRELQARGEVVVKVGDGINDAPGLAAADVGIAMGGGTDVALETADAAVLHGRVLDVARMVALSRRVMGNIRENVAIALGLKVVFLFTTLVGVTGLWPAILADTGATVLVTANALRLLSAKV